MADQYYGPINTEVVLESACVMTNWSNRRSWPAVVRYLRRVGLNDDYIEQHKDYFVEIIRHYSIHYAIGGNIGSSAGLGSPVCQSPTCHPEQLPWTIPHADGPSSKSMITDDEDHFESEPSPSMCNRSVRHEPHIWDSQVETNTASPYTQPDLPEPRAVKLYSYKRNSYIPAISVEGMTSVNYVRRDIAEAAGVEIEQGRATITWHSEGWITTIESEFTVMSESTAPDLMIGHELHAKAERLRGIYWSYKALKHHYRYEAGLIHASKPPHSPHALRSPPTGISRRREPSKTGHPHLDFSPQPLNTDGRRSLFHESSPITRPLSVKSEPIKCSYSQESPLGACQDGGRGTDLRMPLSRENAMSKAPIFSDPGSRSRNRNRTRTSTNLDYVTDWR